MEIKILKQEPKKLLSREECSALIKEKLTPSNAALKEELSKKMGKSAELIVIKRITQKFGQNESEVKFFVYNNEETKKKLEKEKVKKATAA
jgi:ribosomal protein S24E